MSAICRPHTSALPADSALSNIGLKLKCKGTYIKNRPTASPAALCSSSKGALGDETPSIQFFNGPAGPLCLRQEPCNVMTVVTKCFAGSSHIAFNIFSELMLSPVFRNACLYHAVCSTDGPRILKTKGCFTVNITN